MDIKRGNIHLVALDSLDGSEVVRTYQVVVISNDQNNEFAATVTVLPLTSQNLSKIHPFEVFLAKGCGGLAKDVKAKADQIRTIDKKRLIALVGRLSEDELKKLAEAVKIHLDLL